MIIIISHKTDNLTVNQISIKDKAKILAKTTILEAFYMSSGLNSLR